MTGAEWCDHRGELSPRVISGCSLGSRWERRAPQKRATVRPSGWSTATGKGRPILATCSRTASGHWIVVHSNDHQSFILVQFMKHFYRRKVVVTGTTPDKPKIEQDVLSAQVGKLQGSILGVSHKALSISGGAWPRNEMDRVLAASGGGTMPRSQSPSSD